MSRETVHGTGETCAEAVRQAISHGAKAGEAFGVQGRHVNIETQMSEVDFAREEIKQGFGLRVTAKDALGFASTNNKEKITEAVQEALNGSRVRTGVNDFAGFAADEKLPEVKGTWDSRVAGLEISECIDSVQSIIQGAESVKGARVVSSMFSNNGATLGGFLCLL